MDQAGKTPRACEYKMNDNLTSEGELIPVSPYCPDHSKLMQDVGYIKGTLDNMTQQDKEYRAAIFQRLDALTQNGNATKDKVAESLTDQLVSEAKQNIHRAEEHGQVLLDRQKLKPIFWVLIAMGNGIIIVSCDIILRHLWK